MSGAGGGRRGLHVSARNLLWKVWFRSAVEAADASRPVGICEAGRR
jgi:hypothetical protein